MHAYAVGFFSESYDLGQAAGNLEIKKTVLSYFGMRPNTLFRRNSNARTPSRVLGSRRGDRRKDMQQNRLFGITPTPPHHEFSRWQVNRQLKKTTRNVPSSDACCDGTGWHFLA